MKAADVIRMVEAQNALKNAGGIETSTRMHDLGVRILASQEQIRELYSGIREAQNVMVSETAQLQGNVSKKRAEEFITIATRAIKRHSIDIKGWKREQGQIKRRCQS